MFTKFHEFEIIYLIHMMTFRKQRCCIYYPRHHEKFFLTSRYQYNAMLVSFRAAYLGICGLFGGSDLVAGLTLKDYYSDRSFCPKNYVYFSRLPICTCMYMYVQ
jgi:hypothetical protein